VRDDWGTWVSALTPISDRHSGEVLAVFGMDVDAGKWNQLVVAQIWTPLILAGLLVLGILTSFALLRWRASISPRQYEKGHFNKAEIGIILVLGLIVTSLIAWIAHTNEERSRQETFERLAAIRAGYISKNFNDLEKYHMEGLAHFFEASQFVDRQEFSIYTSALADDPTVQAWEWVPAVDFAELPQMISDARQDGLADFVIWELDEDGQRRPVLGGREMFYPVLYAAPLEGNEDALGYDLGSEEVRRAALERALSSGLTTASGPTSLVQETETQLGILVLRPVFPNAAKNTQSGFVAAALRMETLLQSALGPSDGLGSSVYLDLYYVELGSAPTFLSGNAPEDIVAAHIRGELHSHPYADLTYIQPVHAFGQVFALVLHPGPVFNQIYPLQAGWLTALYGILFSTLLAVLTYVLVSRREMLTQQVAERTVRAGGKRSRLP
jgi:CHASE1-domain containing sensor protein